MDGDDLSFRIQMVSCFLAAIFCGMFPPAFGFGCSITFGCMWYLFDNLGLLDVDNSAEALLGTVTLLNIIVHSGTAVQWKHHVNLKSAFMLFILQAPGAFAGTVLVKEYGESLWFERILGLIFLTALLLMYIKNRYAPTVGIFDFNNIWWSWATFFAVSIISVISGILSGVGGIGGAPFIILALYYNFRRETFIGTFMLSRLIISFMIFGILLFKENIYGNDLILTVAATMMGGLFGVILGKELSRVVNHHIYVKVLQVMLLGSSLAVIFDGTGEKVYIVFITIGAIFLYYVAKRGLKRNKTMEHEVLRENSNMQTTGGTFVEEFMVASPSEPSKMDIKWGPQESGV